MLRRLLFVTGILALVSGLVLGSIVLAQEVGGVPFLSPASPPAETPDKEVYGLEVGGESPEVLQNAPLLSPSRTEATSGDNDEVAGEDKPISLGYAGVTTPAPDTNASPSGNITVDGSPALATKGVAPSPDDVQFPGPKREGVLATYSINGTLASGASHYYGPWYFSPGETVTVSISWTPTGSSVDVGLQSANTGTYYYVTCAGGACSLTFQVNVGDNYYVRMRNRGPYTINYNGYITI